MAKNGDQKVSVVLRLLLGYILIVGVTEFQRSLNTQTRKVWYGKVRSLVGNI